MKKYSSQSLITNSCAENNRSCSVQKISNKLVASYINGEKFEFNNVIDLQQESNNPNPEFENLVISNITKSFLNGNNVSIITNQSKFQSFTDKTTKKFNIVALTLKNLLKAYEKTKKKAPKNLEFNLVDIENGWKKDITHILQMNKGQKTNDLMALKKNSIDSFSEYIFDLARADFSVFKIYQTQKFETQPKAAVLTIGFINADKIESPLDFNITKNIVKSNDLDQSLNVYKDTPDVSTSNILGFFNETVTNASNIISMCVLNKHSSNFKAELNSLKMFSVKRQSASNEAEIKTAINDLKYLKKEAPVLQTSQLNMKNIRPINDYNQKSKIVKQKQDNDASSPFNFVKLFSNNTQNTTNIDRKELYEKYYENLSKNQNLNKEFLNATKKISKVAYNIKKRLRIPNLNENRVGKLFCYKSTAKKVKQTLKLENPKLEKEIASKENIDTDFISFSKKLFSVSTNINTLPREFLKKEKNQALNIQVNATNVLKSVLPPKLDAEKCSNYCNAIDHLNGSVNFEDQFLNSEQIDKRNSRKCSFVSLGSKISIEAMGLHMNYFDSKLDSSNAQRKKSSDILMNSDKLSLVSIDSPDIKHPFGVSQNVSDVNEPSLFLDKRSQCSNLDEIDCFDYHNNDLNYCLKKLKHELDFEKALEFKIL